MNIGKAIAAASLSLLLGKATMRDFGSYDDTDSIMFPRHKRSKTKRAPALSLKAPDVQKRRKANKAARKARKK